MATNWFFVFVLIYLSCSLGQEIDKDVEIISGKEMPQPNKQFGQRGGAYYHDFYGVQIDSPQPIWKASAQLVTDGAEGNNGEVNFQQATPFSPILVNMSVSGLPPGKHSVHIHAFGDLKEGCQSTGPHVRNILIGNVDIPESGNLDFAFYSSYVTLFGHRGIVGRSIVFHEKPIEFNRSPDIYGVPVVAPNANPVSYQTEEQAVGATIACGIITIKQNK